MSCTVVMFYKLFPVEMKIKNTPVARLLIPVESGMGRVKTYKYVSIFRT